MLQMIMRYRYWNIDNRLEGATGGNFLRVSETSSHSLLHHSYLRTPSQSYPRVRYQLQESWRIKIKWRPVRARHLWLAFKLVRGCVAFSRLHVTYLDCHVGTRRKNFLLLIPKSR